MDKVSGKLTVYYEDPFWIGVFEQTCNGELSVAKVTFGAEPKEYEVYEFVLKKYCNLKFSPTVAMEKKETKHNPKRMQKIAKRQVFEKGIGTKAQQALKLQHEQCKQERKIRKHEEKDAELKRLIELKQQKKKEKHKGH